MRAIAPPLHVCLRLYKSDQSEQLSGVMRGSYPSPREEVIRAPEDLRSEAIEKWIPRMSSQALHPASASLKESFICRRRYGLVA
jgi:hypothetical protein